MRYLSLALGTAIVAVWSCSDPQGVNCPSVERAALRLVLEDSVTGVRFPFEDVVASARDGGFEDIASVASIDGSATSPTALPLAFGRAGTYEVDVTAQGYDAWSVDGISVSEDQCHLPATRTLIVRLQPTG